MIKSSDTTTVGRKPFTKGWNENLLTSYALPIKKSGKVIQVTKEIFNNHYSKSGQDEEIDKIDGRISNECNATEEIEFDDFITNTNSKKNNKNSKISSVTPSKPLSQVEFQRIKAKVAEICISICADPQQALKRKPKDDSDGTHCSDITSHLTDLFGYINHSNIEVKELSILSTLLVFKDIIPGYQIREDKDSGYDASVKLKKDTKQVLDFEHSLLNAYRRYLNILDSMITEGGLNLWTKQTIGDRKCTEFDITIEPTKHLGFIALKCQCELLRSVPHFNLRSQLVISIVNHAALHHFAISSLSCEYLMKTIDADMESEYSYEIVRAIANTLIHTKYDVPERLVHVLEKIKVRIHEDEVKSIRNQAKKDRKKRKRDNDDVEATMLESLGTNQVLVKRRQADCLKELVLIYFRILKNKIGFKLLPVALEGLARLTHLINMDTVMDLLAVLKRLLESTAPITPLSVRLHCAYCALRTLSGPGEALEMDDQVFVSSLCVILSEMGQSAGSSINGHTKLGGERWDLVLECVELCLIKKRENRKHYIVEILRLLLLQVLSLPSIISVQILSLCHCILIHYPVIRSDIIAGLNRIKRNEPSLQVEDQVEDLAMAPLLKGTANSTSKLINRLHNITNDGNEHMFWSLPLLLCTHSHEIRLKELIKIVTGNNVMPIQYNLAEAKPYEMNEQIIKNIEVSLDIANPQLAKQKLNNKNNAKQHNHKTTPHVTNSRAITSNTTGHKSETSKNSNDYRKQKPYTGSNSNNGKGFKNKATTSNNGAKNSNKKSNRKIIKSNKK